MIGERAPRALILVVLLLFSPNGSDAQTIRTIALSADNDGFVFWKPPRDRLDRYYTHGLKAEAVVDWALPWQGILSRGSIRQCGEVGGFGPCMVTRVAFGQKIFTPNFIFDEDPRNHDRPYAGWLFLNAVGTRVGGRAERSLGLEIGVTGKPSLASPVHRWFHSYLKKHPPLGWEHQIPFEPAFLVRYEERRILPLAGHPSRISIGLEPRFGATLGTLRTSVGAGISVQAGWNGPRPAEWRGEPRRGFFARLGLGLEAEMVARDLFLDGSTFRNSVHADRKPVVGRFHGRIQVGWSRLALEFESTHSTLEFQGQAGGHTYGSITLRFFH